MLRLTTEALSRIRKNSKVEEQIHRVRKAKGGGGITLKRKGNSIVVMDGRESWSHVEATVADTLSSFTKRAEASITSSLSMLADFYEAMNRKKDK